MSDSFVPDAAADSVTAVRAHRLRDMSDVERAKLDAAVDEAAAMMAAALPADDSSGD